MVLIKNITKKNGTKIAPLKVEKEKGESKWICGCGHSKNRPFCDGSHANLVEVHEQYYHYWIWGVAAAVVFGSLMFKHWKQT